MITIQKQPQRPFSRIFLLFFEEQAFKHFPGGFFSSSNRYHFSRKQYIIRYKSVYRTDAIFPGDPNCSSNTCDFSRRKIFLSVEHILVFREALLVHWTRMNFPEASIFSPNRYQFSRKPSRRTHIIFQETLCH